MNLVDPVAVHLVRHKAQILEDHLFALLRQMIQHTDHKAADGIIVLRF